eukprot:363702-Chlamydomonas_euryale.AAC.8
MWTDQHWPSVQGQQLDLGGSNALTYLQCALNTATLQPSPHKLGRVTLMVTCVLQEAHIIHANT